MPEPKLPRVALRRVEFDPFAASPPAVTLPLTEPQKEIWTACQMGAEASCSYNQVFSLRLRGPLCVESMRNAFRRVLERHEGLRVAIAADGESQTVLPPSDVPLPLTDLSGLPPARRAEEVARILERETESPFDLASGPLVRVQVVREEPNLHCLVVAAHHIVCDGWSSAVLFRDLGAAYRADRTGLEASLPPAASYADYVRDHVRQLGTPIVRADEEYWAHQFSDSVPVLQLPIDQPRPPLKTYRGDRRELRIEASLYRDLRKSGARAGATLFSVVLAAFEVLLHRLTLQTDLVVGIPIAGQALLENGHLVGHCVNTLPLRARIAGDEPFSQHLKRSRQALVDAQEHQGLTFGSLLRRLNVPRDPGRTPLVSATFNIDKLGSSFDFGDLALLGVSTPKAFVNFEMAINVVDSGTDMVVECAFNTDLLTSATIDRWLGHYRRLLEAIALDPSRSLLELPLLTGPERELVLVGWNRTEMEIAGELRLHRLFEEQAARTPKAEAVVFGRERLTYEELNRRSNQLAHHLRRLGVGPEVAVAVCMRRGVDLIVSMLGVLKAGGAYVPLDPGYPRDRVAFMLEDSRAAVLLTQADLADLLPSAGTRRVCVDADWDEIGRSAGSDPAECGTPNDLAYVVYTSGSTGVPKGVAIEHRSAGTLLHWARTVFSPGELSGVLASTSICFDLSVFEIFVPLAWGGRVILADNVLALSEQAARDEVTLVNTVPSAAAELVRAAALPSSVRTVCLAGEHLGVRLVNDLYATGHVRCVYDLYGPSEDTTYSTYALRLPDAPPTIGRPIANTQAYILDSRQEPVPIGVVGELHLAGAGLARGYLHRPDLTAERFVRNPFSARPGDRMYKTGDLTRYRNDGNLEFLGRIDHQVKIRGFRIELGEIESVIRQHPGVRETVVLAREDVPGDRRLVAYVAAEGDSGRVVDELRSLARARLPEYMVPAQFVPLLSLPLTPNGKVDREALSRMESAATPHAEHTPPRTGTEKRVSALWERVLGVPGLGVTDNFFDLGGHSLSAARVMTELRAAFGVDLVLRQLFEHPTVARLSDVIDHLVLAAAVLRSPAAAPGREEAEF